jgi:AI-2 transport protein TqsA
LLKSLDLVADRFRKFVLVSSLLGLITGALYIGWLSLFGIDLVLLWGLLAFLLNYLPMVGSVVAGLLPVLMALVQKDPGTAAVVAGGLLVIEQVMGNTVAPLLQGKQLSVSPLVIMASLLVMSWMWGMAGAILATPVTVLLTIVFHEVPELRPAALFLSDQPDLEGLDEQLRS